MISSAGAGSIMRVFVSSTIYDLLDVRNEIAELLRDLGIAAVLSDDKLSDFSVQLDANSIETCLVNVESCDEVIVILDKRYGPSLGECGYDDISATHLEYRHAVKHRKPIHFFVRDRLEADYSIWKKNRKSGKIKLSWVQEEADYGLFDFLKEHKKLSTNKKASNWFTTFTNSIDLKSCLQRRLETAILPQKLVDAIYENRFPLFHVSVDLEYIELGGQPSLNFKATLKNIGEMAALNFTACWKKNLGRPDDDELCSAIMAPGQTLLMGFTYILGGEHNGTETSLFIEYESTMGISVLDEFHVAGHFHPGQTHGIIGGARLLKRTFKRAEKPAIEIEGV